MQKYISVKPHISIEEVSRVSRAVSELKNDAIQVYQLIVQKINRYKLSRKLDKPMTFTTSNDKEATIGYVTNDSIHLFIKNKLVEKVPIREVPIEVIISLSFQLGFNVTKQTNGKY